MPLNDNRDSSMERLTPTLNELTRVLGELSDVVGDLQGIGKDFTKDVGKSASALKDTSKAFEKENSTLDKTLQKHGAKFDGYAKAAVQSLSVVLSFALNKFEKGFNSIVENFNQNFTAITSRQQYTQRQYASMLNGFTKWVETHDLRTQFSQIDLSNALIPVLQTGIRGGLAEEMAKRNVVTEKLLPMINTNTRAYMRMSKLFGDTFTQGITAIGTYTERYLQSAEGLEEGNLDSIIQTVYRELGEVAKTPEQFNKMMQETIASYQIMASKYGADYAGTALQNYSKWISGEGVMSGDLASILPGKSASNRSFDAFGKAMETIFSTYIDGRMPSGYGASAYGFSKETIQDYMIGQKFNKDMTTSMDEVLAGFDATTEYQKDMYTLSQGAYNSITEQQNKFNENAMAYLGTLAAENIPDVQGSLNLIKGTLSLFFTAWLTSRTFGKVTGGGSGGHGSGNSLLSKFSDGYKNPAFINGGSFTMFGKQIGGSKLAGIDAGIKNVLGTSGGSGFGGAATATGSLINFAAGPGALIAGAALATKNGISAWKNTSEEGAANGGRFKSLLEGAFTGDTSGARTVNERLAEAKRNKGGLDWKKVGRSAGVGALVGTGIGTAAGGWAAGLGTVIGAGAGAITGAVASIVQQMAKYGEQNKFLKTELGKLAETAQETSKAMSEQSEKFTKYGTTLEEYSSVVTKLNDTSSNLSNVDRSLLEIKKNQLETELALLRLSTPSVSETTATAHAAGSGLTKGMATAEVYNVLSKSKAGLKGLNLNKNKISEQSWDQLLGATGQSKQDAYALVQSGLKGGFLKEDQYKKNVEAYGEDTANLWAYRAMISAYVQGNENYFGWGTNLKGSDLDADIVGGSGGYNLFTDTAMENVISGVNTNSTSLSSAVSEARNSIGKLQGYTAEMMAETESYDYLRKNIARAIINAHQLTGKNRVENFGSSTLDDFLKSAGLSDDIIQGYKDYLATGVSEDTAYNPPWYFKGTHNLLRSGLIRAHKGEMILPASAAENLRELSGAHSIEGVSSFLKSLLGLSKATPTASALPDTSTVDTLTSAIEAQTQALSKILNSILDRVSNIDGMMDGQLRRNLNQGNVPEMVRSWFGFPLTEN